MTLTKASSMASKLIDESGMQNVELPPDNTEDKDGAVDFETAIRATGYGKFHYWFVFLCGMAYSCAAVEALSVSFLLPSAECDLLMTSTDKGWLSAIIFIGMMIGGYIWGALADSLGRREILIASLMMDAIFSICSSLAQSFGLFLTLRFFGGMGIAGMTVVIFPYVAEFQPSDKRGAIISFVASFFMIGNILMAGLAWAVIPQSFSTPIDASFTFNSWRLFTALCGTISLLAGLALLPLPESPRFLLAKSREQDALAVFRRIFTLNTGHPGHEYPHTKFLLGDAEDEESNLRWKEKLQVTFRNVSEQSKTLFAHPLLRNIMLMIIIQFALQFADLGLLLWLPDIFNSLENYYKDNPDNSVTVCQIVGYNATASDSGLSTCPHATPDDQVYINALIVALTPLPGNIWTYFHMDFLGRKFFLVGSMLGAGVCGFMVWIVRSSTDNLIVSSFFSFFATMAFNAINVLGTELFPTSVRSTAMAITQISARIGAILGTVLFGALVDLVCAVPILLVAGFMIGGGLLGLLFPNTTKSTLT